MDDPLPSNPETQPAPPPAQQPTDSGCGLSPQTVQGAYRSDASPASPTTPPPRLCHSNPDPEDYLKGLELARLEETYAEPDYDGDYDYEETARERELMIDDLASDINDFTRSDEDGWFYSDEG